MTKELPQNCEAEQAVLGSMILEPFAIEKAKELLIPGDFYMDAHRAIFNAVLSVANAGEPVDIVTLSETLRQSGSLESVGGELYLYNLMEAPSSAANVAYYAGIVKDKATQRNIMARATEVFITARDGKDKQGRKWDESLVDSGRANISDIAKDRLTPPENPFIRGLVCANAIPVGDPPPSLWFGLYRSSVVLFVGETGAGKSSLLYNVAIHAARHEPLFNIPFGGSLPLKVLYIDPENAGNWAEGQGGNCRAKLNRIGAGTPEHLYFHDGDGINLSDPATCDELERLIIAQRFDIVIIDPIANLFRTKNEDANSEAAEHFTRLKAMSRKTGACIVAVHHTGKGTLNDYGRGASARLASADVGIMFRFKGDDEERDDTYTGELRPRTDICRLQITKNRLEGEGSLYLRMAGDDRFIVGSFEDWNNTKGSEGRQDKSESAEPHILQYLQDGVGHSREEIIQQVQERGIGKHSIDAGILALKERGKIIKEVLPRNKHVYKLVTPTSVVTTEKGERAQAAVDDFFGDNGTEDAEPPIMERMRF